MAIGWAFKLFVKNKGGASRPSRRELRQLNKSLRICDNLKNFLAKQDIFQSDIAYRQLYSPYGELRIYLISLWRKPKYHAKLVLHITFSHKAKNITYNNLSFVDKKSPPYFAFLRSIVGYTFITN